jgi:uncharacterized membrane protein YhaH (DUF805 family)
MSDINWGRLLFGFSGRINRAKWWLAVLVSIIISVVVAAVTNVISSEGLGAVISLAGAIPQIWISLAAGVKRLHDLNRTGAWLVLFYLAPVVLVVAFFAIVGIDVMGALISDKPLESGVIARVGTTAVIIGLLLFILWVWALIWFGCLRGTVGPNQYGPDPLEGRV